MTLPLILLVEDNPDDEALTLDALRMAGMDCRIAVARDGAEALQTCFSSGQVPDLVLLDLKLPRRSGLEVLAEMRAQESTRYTPVVVLTSSTEEKDMRDSYRFGANSYVRKSIDFDQFSDSLRILSHYWLRLNLVPSSLYSLWPPWSA